MKKTLLVLMSILCVGLVQAQSLDVSANFGVITRNDFKFDPLILSGNVTIDFSVSKFLMISPECTFYANSKFASATMILAPGGTLNFTVGPLAIGAGIVKEFWLKSSDVSIPLELKIRAGIQASKYRLGAYMLTPFDNLFKQKSFGFTLGFAL
jgi:hypothetical protein